VIVERVSGILSGATQAADTGWVGCCHIHALAPTRANIARTHASWLILSTMQ
jgi:hypothetical protein